MKAIYFLAAVFPSIALATEEPNSCHDFSVGEERLACYDKSTSYDADGSTEVVTGVQGTEARPEPGGEQWRVSIKESVLEDRKDVYISVPSTNRVSTGYGNSSTGLFYVRCMKNQTNAFITFSSYTSDNQNVKYRFDDGARKSVRMEVMTGGDGIGIWSGSRAIPFIKELLNKEKLVVAYESYSNSNIEFEFDISGLSAKLGPLAESCGWNF